MVARELLVRKPLFRNPTRGQSTSSSDPTDYLDRLHNPYNPTSCASYASTLRLCGNEKALLDGRRAHSLIITRGLEQNKLLANLLVHMYGSCGVLQDACYLFARLRKRDPFSWNFMMTAFTRQGCFKEALELFDDMQLEGVKPDKFIFASILSACAEKAALATGKHIHILIMTHELELDVVLANAIVNMYAKCGHLEDARAMFHGIHHKIDASWNAIISGFAQDGQGQDAIILFNQMMMEGAMPNKVTFIGVVSACANEEYLIQGKQMHARLAASEYESDVVLANTLINMYGKCGNLKKSRELFDNLPQRSTVSWNAMITSYAQHGQGWKAFELFNHLHQEGALANRVTFRSLLPGFDHTTSKECKRLHTRIMSSNLGPDIDMISSLVNMYCKCGNFRDALEVFEFMLEHDLLAWNALISGYSQHALDKPALWHFHQMLQEGVLPDKTTFLSILLGCANHAVLAEGNQIHALLAGSKIESDVVVGSALLNMYGKCGSVQDACTMFYGMPERNEYSWTAMITAYAEHGQARDAMLLFERMQWEGINLDRVAILCMLCACSNQAALTHGKHAHTYVLGTQFETDVTVGNALVTMYSKCGSLENARKVFNRMPEQNLVSWTAVIAACAQHGQGKEAIRFFEQMQKQGEDPDKVTYAEILSACSHAGLVDEACHALASMKQCHGIKPTVDHYNCLIDLLTRTGRLDVAEHVILNMPLRPTAVSWLTLLGACRSQLDLRRGERAAKWACDLCLEDPAPFVTLSNLYAGSGRFDDAAWVINQMWLRGQEQHLGSCSMQGKV